MFHASFQTVLMLFCTEACISVVDKTTDPCCFVFYIERKGKTPGVTSLYLLEKDRGELSTRCLMPTCLRCTLLLFCWNASPQSSNSTVLQGGSLVFFSWDIASPVSFLWSWRGRGQYRSRGTSEGEMHSFCHPFLFSLETLSYHTHTLLITKCKLKQFPFHVKDGVK